MQNKTPYNRRQFLATAGALSTDLFRRTGAAALAAIAESAVSAHAAAEDFTALDADDARDFAAMAARIMPTTDTPGATEAGVVYFFDRALAGDMAGSLPFLEAGLRDLNAGLPGRIGTLDSDAQDAALRSIEDGDFFGLVHAMTIFGFFAMSKYGGNRDNTGWKVIGFEGHHGPWTYPFGYYDAQAEAADGN